jgi:hypothetical protein
MGALGLDGCVGRKGELRGRSGKVFLGVICFD